MMTFAPVRITSPASLGRVGDTLAPALAEVGASLGAGASALGDLGLPALPDLPPVPGLPSAESLRAGQKALLTKGAACIMLSPYDYGLGQRNGEEAWLTPVAALRSLADRLGGLGGLSLPALPVLPALPDLPDVATDTALVLLLAASVDQAGMASALGSLGKAFPLPDVQKLERRAQGVASLHKDKFVIPPCPASPPWGTRSPEALPLSREASRLMGAQLAQAEGREAAQKPLGEVMQAFAQRQAEAVQAASKALHDMTGSLADADPLSGWFGVYLEGPAAEAAKLLAKLAPPVDEAFKCCTVMCWHGKKDEVAYYKELFGL